MTRVEGRKTTMLVIKLGGAAGIDPTSLSVEIAALWNTGVPCILVHGGGAETDQLAARLDHPMRTVTTPSGHVSRYTDRATLEIFAMATARINRVIVESLQRHGVNAFGLSGLDGRLLTARRKEVVRSVEGDKVRLLRDDWTGSVARANGALLQMLLDQGYLPVVAPLAVSERGEMLNVDGDRAAAAVAVAVGADTLLLLSNVPGLLRDVADPASLIHQLHPGELEAVQTFAHGRMKKKLMGAGEALHGGVRRVVIGDARRAQPIGDALAGVGTVIAEDEGFHVSPEAIR